MFGWVFRGAVAALALASAVGACRCSCTCNDTCPAVDVSQSQSQNPSTKLVTRPQPSPSKVPEQYRAIHNLHNAYRRRHNLPALAWSPRVAKSAESWARRCQFRHESQSQYGENLYAVWGQPNVERALSNALSNAAATWYDEGTQYVYASPGFSMKTGHFTQMVWKNSKKLGCAARQCGPMTLVVCRYDPPGNVIGHFRANVPKLAT